MFINGRRASTPVHEHVLVVWIVYLACLKTYDTVFGSLNKHLHEI